MAHFAELNENGLVTQVVVVHNNELLDADGKELEQRGIDFCAAHFGGRWVQTSYNSRIRGVYAGIGFSYSEEEDIFIEPQTYPSWNRVGSFWQPPTPMPEDGKLYAWNEEAQEWNIAP